MIDTKKNIERFEELVATVKRDGMDRLLNMLKGTDFYIAPASTKFHLSCEGGLLQHSLNVYDCLVAKKESPLWKNIVSAVDDESLIIMALFHDICKINCYKKGFKNQKTYDPQKIAASTGKKQFDEGGEFVWETVQTYTMDDEMPLGHGEKSVMILDKYIELTKEETYAIRWHMGFSEEKGLYGSLGKAMEKYPIVLAIHEADLEASKLLEGEDGNK